jgi:DNA-binding transcriptional LysR family regulator
MDIRRLEAFSKVFESRSFSRAAKELYLSQPSIFHLLHLAHAEIDLLRHTVSGPIILGGSTIPADYVLPPLLATFLRLYPDVRIDLRVGDTESVVEMVRRGDVMMAMVGSAADIRDLVFVPVLVDDPVLIGTHDQLQGITGSEKDLSFLSRLTWVMREPGSGTRQALESALKARGLAIQDLNVAIQVQNTQAMLGCVLAGLGVSVTSRMIVEPYVHRKEIQALALPSLAMSRSFYLVHHQKRELFPATRELQTFLTKTLAAGSITDV